MNPLTAIDPSLEQMLEMYRQMILIRLFEEQAIELFAKRLITGSTHPCIGQEAIAVGVCTALKGDDQVLATYRGHGAALAKGCPPSSAMAELLTRKDGCSKGRGGSLHLCDVGHGFWGTNAIVAGHLPIAGGVALSNKLRETGHITACFFGDGASCEGEFFETLNMASLWQVPLLFVCENNGYAISVPTSMSQSTPDIADRARGFGIPAAIVDGNDILAVHQAALAAASTIRDGSGPAFLECKTVRWERHSAFSAGGSKNPGEAQKWKHVDPIPRFAKHLIGLGVSDSQLAEIRSKCQEEIESAVQFALQSPPLGVESIYDGIFAEPAL